MPPLTSRPCALGLLLALLLGACSATSSRARSFTAIQPGCLFQLRQPWKPALAVIPFSLLSLSGRALLRQASAPALKPAPQRPEPEAAVRAQLSASVDFREDGPIAGARMEDWPLYGLLTRWRTEAHSGSSREFVSERTEVGFDYSDIFETGADPDRGGHGISFLFRYSFRR